MGILSHLLGRRIRSNKSEKADRLLKESLASLRKAVEQQERDEQATLDHMKHIFDPDNFISAEFEGGMLKVKHRY